MENNFYKAREVFRDVVDLNLYVPLSHMELLKEDIIRAIDQKEKMIFITGEAGSGKSVLLKSVYEILKNRYTSFLINNPYLEIDSILELLKTISIDDYQVFLIDEAQLLSSETFENLRIYADKGNISIIFATHDTDLNKLFRKKHFSTRVNYVLKTKKLTLFELENFIRTKLLKANLISVSEMFKKKNYKLIYKYTNGSLRATNQLLFKVFDIMHYFYVKDPKKVDINFLQNKYIHMAHMDIKDIHA